MAKDSSVGSRLRFARKNAGLTQRQVSSRAGVQYRNYSKYETGDSNPPPDVLVRLCNVLDVSSDFVLGMTDDFSPKENGRDYICLMGSDGMRHMYNIPQGMRDRVSSVLKAGFPEIMNED